MTNTPRRSAQALATAEAERRLLRLVVSGALHRSPGGPRPAYTVAELASRAELEHERCCRALYWLVRRGRLRVELLGDGRFQLIPQAEVGPNDPAGPVAHA